ncbi:hypothetical protein ES703_57293 [subsurface metagenome]
MPTVAISDTEINPTKVVGYGGGRKTATDTELSPTYKYYGSTVVTETEINPAYVVGYGGGRKEITDTELPPTLPAPEVTTDAATGVGPVTATLNGTLDDDGEVDCECSFEWGRDISYGISTPIQSKTKSESFSQALGGLEPNTTYHFRAIATNVFGTSYGDDRTFTTSLIISRAYALAREEL